MGKRLDWRIVTAEVKAAVQAGEVRPVWTEISKMLGIGESTIRTNFTRRKIGLEEIKSWQSPKGEIYATIVAFLRKPRTMEELCNKLHMSPNKVNRTLEGMRSLGYKISANRNYLETASADHIIVAPAPSISQEMDDSFIIATPSDLHSGSIFSQPSSLGNFIATAHKEGVRNFLIPGDLFHGVFGYRGMINATVPGAWPQSRDLVHQAAKAQIFLVNEYLKPDEYPDCNFYVIGGNHDAWFLAHGVDAVGDFAAQHDNVYFLGYHKADVQLTKRISARMWHPTGGVPYARSYRAQKGVENVMMEVLHQEGGADIWEELPPQIKLLFVGHLHIESKLQLGGVTAAQVGCFEGTSDYLAQKGLFPIIGAGIWEVHTEGVFVKRLNYDFISYPEVTNDWKNFQLPPAAGPVILPVDDLKVVFTKHKKDSLVKE